MCHGPLGHFERLTVIGGAYMLNYMRKSIVPWLKRRRRLGKPAVKIGFLLEQFSGSDVEKESILNDCIWADLCIKNSLLDCFKFRETFSRLSQTKAQRTLVHISKYYDILTKRETRRTRIQRRKRSN